MVRANAPAGNVIARVLKRRRGIPWSANACVSGEVDAPMDDERGKQHPDEGIRNTRGQGSGKTDRHDLERTRPTTESETPSSAPRHPIALRRSWAGLRPDRW